MKNWKPPVPVFTFDRLPFNAHGFALPFCVLMKRGHENRQDLLRHEWLHVQRMWKWGLIPWALLYLFFPHFRFREEVRGYAESVRYGADLSTCAKSLADNYYLPERYTFVVCYWSISGLLKEKGR